MAPFIRSPYNYDLDQASDEACVKDFGPSLTVQSQAWNLHDALVRGGVIPGMPEGVVPLGYQDFDNIVDFQTAMNAVRQAQENFDMLPADTRARFMNNPQQFLEFCENPANMQAVKDMGLSVPEDWNERQAAGGGSPPQGGAPPEAGGAGAPSSVGGASVPK